MPNPSKRRIVLTGVSRGLGRAMAEAFIARGHTLIGCARSAAPLDDLRRRYGRPHRFDVADVCDDAAVQAWAATVLADGGPPDLLINNAATINRNARLWEVSAEEFAGVLAANLAGIANVVRRFVPAMIARGRGVIVNFSSYWGRSVAAEVAPYCATKWGVEGLTRSLAEELPSGMAAVPFNPGVINTEMLQSCFGPAAASYAQPDEWARRAAPFLLQLGPKDNGQPLTAPGE
jgi:NAD(P)-dependent dehydrogenase (short-subunit alcohol dehydrogenase family)